MQQFHDAADRAIERCRTLARFSEEPSAITRTFLSPPMHQVHACFTEWAERAGMRVRVDAAGNIRASRESLRAGASQLYIGSHLDTVPHAGAFDGVLGVVMGLGLVELASTQQFSFEIEVVGFSEEEGVRFGVPFIGSRALAGDLHDDLLGVRDRNGVTVAEAIRAFGLDPSRIPEARAPDGALGYLEFHIEQGPVLESLGLPLGVVESIVGQSRLRITFAGSANHAGTTPMRLRHDALAGAAEWIGVVEREARDADGLVATVGQVAVEPGAGNVIPGVARLSLDVRHARDSTRRATVERLLSCASEIAAVRDLTVSSERLLDQPAVQTSAGLSALLEMAAESSGQSLHHLDSGAGHDAMIMAPRTGAAMLFVRSPGGISHHPDESVLSEDVAAAFRVGLSFLEQLEAACQDS